MGETRGHGQHTMDCYLIALPAKNITSPTLLTTNLRSYKFRTLPRNDLWCRVQRHNTIKKVAHQSLSFFELVFDLLAKAFGVGGKLKVILGVALLYSRKKKK